MNEESRAVNKNYSFESALIVSFSAVALLVHLLTNGRYGYFRDELYYIACARHLDFGYIDQPPLSILLGSVEKVVVLSVVMYKWGGHERSWTCAVCPCGVGSEPGSCACLQSSFFSAAFHSAAVVSDFMFDALRGLDVSRGGSSSGRAW